MLNYIHLKNIKYKIIIFDNTKNSLGFVKSIYTNEPITKSEVQERIKKEAKLLGYPSLLVDVENILKMRINDVNLKWYYITYILTEKDKKVGEIYTFFCTSDVFQNIQVEIKERKERYNTVIGNFKDYKVLLLCIEERTFKRIIFYTFGNLKWHKNDLKKTMFIVVPGVFLWTFSGVTSTSV